jgi:hypothetical protein
MTEPFLPDLGGPHYLDYIKNLHSALGPRAYLEIGTCAGESLKLASCSSIAVDPQFAVTFDVLGKKPVCLMYQSTSDDFFSTHDPTKLLGRHLDLVFLDGLHLFEVLLRDFINAERFCRPGSLIMMHDCIPTDVYIADRKDDPERRRAMGSKPSWWTGDVWKLVPILKQWRPHLSVRGLDCAPTGLVLITNLDQSSRVLIENYQRIVDQFAEVDLDQYGLSRLHSETGIEGAASVRLPVVPWSSLSATS